MTSTICKDDFIFGYGSIVNDYSRLATLCSTTSISEEISFSETGYHSGGQITGDLAAAAFLSPQFGYSRSWSFRAPTGFTALGLVAGVDSNPQPIFGVVFPVSNEGLSLFDQREVGYRRVEIPAEHLTISLEHGSTSARERAKQFIESLSFSRTSKIWVYIPEESSRPSEDHPILQTYVDICVRGCLRWGGEALAGNFLISTFGWSEYFLNDAPLSRRPWLHRLDYGVIDACLEKHAAHVKYFNRLHPEEFSARHLTALHGMWGVCSRNLMFIGREMKLIDLHKRLTKIGLQQAELVGFGGVGKSQIALEYCHRHFGRTYGLIVWLRAESSSSIAADLRRFAYDLGIIKKRSKSSYSSGRSRSSPAQGDMAVSSKLSTVLNEEEEDDEVVLDEVHRRLQKCRCKWLFVFDNLEDPELLKAFLPRGCELGFLGHQEGLKSSSSSSFLGQYTPIKANMIADRPSQTNLAVFTPYSLDTFNSGSSGHVLVTSRIVFDQWANRSSSVMIECFDDQESVRFLEISLNGNYEMDSLDSLEGATYTGCTKESQNLKLLSSKLGNLPLALSVATAYMIRCDVSSEEYLERLNSLGYVPDSSYSDSSVSITNHSLVSSLSITLDRVCSESSILASILSPLGYLAPDQISRSIISDFIKISFYKLDGPYCTVAKDFDSSKVDSSKVDFWYVVFGCVASVILLYMMNTKASYSSHSWLSSGFLLCLALFLGNFVSMRKNQMLKQNREEVLFRQSFGLSVSCTDTSREAPEDKEKFASDVDRCWELLKKFSLLIVRGSRKNRVGSIHRLQQSVMRQYAPQNFDIDDSMTVVIGQKYCDIRSRGALFSLFCLESVVWAINKSWKFNITDSATWESCSLLIEHINNVQEHAREACSIANSYDSIYSTDIVTRKPVVFLRYEYAKILGRLVIDAAKYYYCVLSRFDIAFGLAQSALDIFESLVMLPPEQWKTAQGLIPPYLRALPEMRRIDFTLCEERSDCLHSLGEILRYQGNLAKSEETLQLALNMRQSLSTDSF